MTWFFIVLTLLLGFAEYYCAIYFVRQIFGITDNRAHLIVGTLVLVCCSLPRDYIFAGFVAAALFTPLILFLGITLTRNK